MTQYFRPIPMVDTYRTADAQRLAGGWCWFDRVAVLERGREPEMITASDVPQDVLDQLTKPRPSVMGLPMSQPQVMGILNVTPDSFSDGGDFVDPAESRARALQMKNDGAAIIDIGGESTRPGAKEVPREVEADRVGGAIEAIRETSQIPISVDTRKASVVQSSNALQRGAPWMINDVSAAQFDPLMADVAAKMQIPICLMHAVGTPETMQSKANYADVVFDVYDHLAERVEAVISAGVRHDDIIVDPGIGFGKTIDHNLALLQNLSLFHGLGCPILLGASRKRFIGTIGGEDDPKERVSGSVAVAQWAVQQGVQILRVHDTKPTMQMINLTMAVMTG